jgi:hypothetical protein
MAKARGFHLVNSMTATETKERKDGLISEMKGKANDVHSISNMKEDVKKKYLAKVKEDTRQVKAKFKNFQSETAIFKIVYKKYGCEPIQTWEFKHDENYIVPYGLVEHINENCKIFNYPLNANDPTPPKRVQLQQFVPISFF